MRYIMTKMAQILTMQIYKIYNTTPFNYLKAKKNFNFSYPMIIT